MTATATIEVSKVVIREAYHRLDLRGNLYLVMLGVNIDISAFKDLAEGLEGALKKACSDASRDLAAATHAKAVEIANEKLHSRRQPYIEALKLSQEGDVWVLSLAASARWIEDGMPPHNMLDDLLASPNAKGAKDGSRYVIVPFEHGPGKGPGNDTKEHQDLVNTLKQQMKKGVLDLDAQDKTKRVKIPWGGIERDDQGRPKLGRLHRFNINDSPLKTQEGPGQGRGPIGDVRQGPNMRQRAGGGPAGGGNPFLQGVAVYQKLDDKGAVKRSVMTFRIASSNQQGESIWDHPGLEAVGIMDEAWTWAMDQVETLILPKLIETVWAAT